MTKTATKETTLVKAYYLENTLPGHHKFYLICITDEGTVFTNWGKIGASGQSKLQRMPNVDDAEAVGMRQFFSKRSGGYEVLHEGVTFSLPTEWVNNQYMYQNAFWQKVNSPEWEADRDAVLKNYEDFKARAQKLLASASTSNFASVQQQHEELKRVWAEIQDAHAEVEIVINLTEQSLAAALMSGKL